jgi:purine-binding chemotaxis protein CheW
MSTQSEHDTRKIVVFGVEDTEYGLPIESVREIIRFVPPQPTAGEDAWMRGVINLRGSIIPVCDLAMRLRGASTPNDDPTARILIVESEGSQAGVVVSAVDEVRSIAADQLESAPTTSDGLIDAIAKVEDRLVVLLDGDLLIGGM